MAEDKNIHVNYRPENDKPSDSPLTSQDPGQGLVVREALDSLSSLKSIPKDLNDISHNLEKAVQPRMGIFAVYALSTIAIAALAYLLVSSHLNEILANNRLHVTQQIEQSRRENITTMKTLEDTYKTNLETLSKNISGQTKAINTQIETNYKIMHDAYKKREAQLQTLVDKHVEELEKLRLEHKILLKENERLLSTLKTVSEKRSNR